MKRSRARFLRFVRPIIEVLKQMGGSGRSNEVTDAVIQKLGLSEQEQAETLKNGRSRVAMQVAWARLYLVRGGYLDSSKRGVWSLTTKGYSTSMNEEDAFSLYKTVRARLRELRKGKARTRRQASAQTDAGDELAQEGSEEAYKYTLLEILRALPPSGFERLSQRLLREAGFTKVVVTGRSGDGGIDGHGILQLNQLVTFKVLFQCKRYGGSVSASQVRDFRGAMAGRADKGIILSTGTFTTAATNEAHRDGVPTIELVDGSKMVEMFEQLELGLRPRQTYEVDAEFFREFQDVTPTD